MLDYRSSCKILCLRPEKHYCQDIGLHLAILSLCCEAICNPVQSCSATAKPVTLLVTDACDSCAPNQLNLHALAFQDNFNSDLSVGRVNVSFQQVLE